MLHFILGPSGSGKSHQMLAELRTRAERGERSILIVPEQFTSSTEGQLYRTLGDSLSAYVDSYSFTSLSEALLRRYGGAAVPTLTEAGRALLLRRAADSLLDKVVYYSRQRRSAAFCEKAAQTISELKSAGVTPEMLADYAKRPVRTAKSSTSWHSFTTPMRGCWPRAPWTPGTASSVRRSGWTRNSSRAGPFSSTSSIPSTRPSVPCWRPCCRWPT